MNLLETVVDAIWEGFKAENNACVDREMDLIDTGGSYEVFSMERVAAHVIATLGLREESKYLQDGWVSMATDRTGVIKTSGKPPTRVSRGWSVIGSPIRHTQRLDSSSVVL